MAAAGGSQQAARGAGPARQERLRGRAARREARRLHRLGFVSAATRLFKRRGSKDEGLSGAMVFNGHASAESQKRRLFQRSFGVQYRHAGIGRFSIDGIPGSKGMTATPPPKRRGGAANLYFTVGPCALALGVYVDGHPSADRLEQPLRHAAAAVVERARSSCR